MEASVTAIRARLEQPWLPAPLQERVMACFETRLAELNARQAEVPAASVLLAESDPAALLGGLLAAVAAHAPVFLANPDWRENEWAQVAAQLEPTLTWGRVSWPERMGVTLPPMEAFRGHLMIPTGGTGGRVRFAAHTWETLGAAVAGYGEFFQAEPVNAWCVLPLWHVSGLMQALRTLMSGGRLVPGDYRDLAGPETGAALPERGDFHLSLVPTQLGRILALPGGAEWLRGFGLLLIGGAGMPPDLREKAIRAGLGLACSYGMTETAAVVAAQRPGAFLAGESLAGEVFPHVRVTVETGEIAIRAKSLFRGYYPEPPAAREEFRPGDEGALDEKGRLRVIGRRDRLIITGGEKVDPREVEAAIRAVSPSAEALVVGEPDPDWGQRVTALVAGVPNGELPALQAALRERLQAASVPKRWLAVAELPLKPNGKPDHGRLAQALGMGGK